VGPNGAGKSTLIRHLAGILQQDSGEVMIDATPVFNAPAVKARVAYIPDEIEYYTQATVLDMAKFYAGIYPQFDMESCRALLADFRLPERHMMRNLSKGMQKQAAFSFALSRKPEVVVLDEPVDGLDPIMRRKVWGLLLEQVAERETTVLVSSHNLRELEDVCDRVGIMNHGTMLIERELAELQDSLVKLQLVLPEGSSLAPELTANVLHSGMIGSVQQLIVRGREEEILSLVTASGPLFVDVLPLTLEEIFIYEVGGEEHELHNIIL